MKRPAKVASEYCSACFDFCSADYSSKRIMLVVNFFSVCFFLLAWANFEMLF